VCVVRSADALTRGSPTRRDRRQGDGWRLVVVVGCGSVGCWRAIRELPLREASAMRALAAGRVSATRAYAAGRRGRNSRLSRCARALRSVFRPAAQHPYLNAPVCTYVARVSLVLRSQPKGPWERVLPPVDSSPPIVCGGLPARSGRGQFVNCRYAGFAWAGMPMLRRSAWHGHPCP
jgi:hypothetical protein